MDLATAREMLNLYISAEKAIAGGAQSYKIGDKELTRANLSHIRKHMTYWHNKVREFESNQSGRRGITIKKAVYVG